MTLTVDISPKPKVTILMAVRDGAAHLPVQLASIAAQSHDNWQLICSDDGSIDTSKEVLYRFAAQHPRQVAVHDGPQQGFSANFMSLIRQLPTDAGFVCFADQDDYWHSEKLMRSLSLLQQQNEAVALACGRRAYWYPERYRYRISAPVRRHCGLKNALAENIATGNTIMLSPDAARLARNAACRTGPVFAHDWWLYLLITGCGGSVVFDNGPPHVMYRQHGRNAIGAGQGLRAQLQRKAGVLRGTFMARMQGNLDALQAIPEMLTPEASATLRSFAAARKQGVFGRLAALHRVGLYRQHWAGTLGFWGAASLGRI